MEFGVHIIAAGAGLPPGGAEAVGNKAWNLARLVAAGLPVPPAFVLPTSWCQARRRGEVDDAALMAALDDGIARLEAVTDLGFGSARRPLLVSVRSGAAVSMPGMLETILDVGLNAPAVDGMLRLTGNPRLAWDSYRRLVQAFAEVVQGLPVAPFEALIARALAAAEVENERDLDHRSLRRLTQAMLDTFQALAGVAFPAEPRAQLLAATAAVFRSWDAPKADQYRRLHGLDAEAGTAVTVQAMVFGNAGGASGAGVGFTRNPATGERELYLDFAPNGQGEDVVAGRRTVEGGTRLRRMLPGVHTQLEGICRTLEGLFGDAQDFEFTLQRGALWLLQTRRAKRTSWAALRIAVDLVEERLIVPAEALRLLDGIAVDQVVRTRFVDAGPVVAQAQGAGLGVASGAIAFDTAAAVRMADRGPVILVRRETATEDITGMSHAAGVLTGLGGRTSHAAVVARQLGVVCVVGCRELTVDLARRTCRIGAHDFDEGDAISLDGNTGTIHAGLSRILTERPERELAAIAMWRASGSAAPPGTPVAGTM